MSLVDVPPSYLLICGLHRTPVDSVNEWRCMKGHARGKQWQLKLSGCTMICVERFSAHLNFGDAKF